MQEIRIRERRKAIDKENKIISESRKEGVRVNMQSYANGDSEKQLLARARYLLFKPSDTWTDSQKERATILFSEYPTIKKAYDLSLYFRSIFERKISPEFAQIELNTWYEQVTRENIPELTSAANTIKENEGKILGYFKNRETNAGAESFNAKIK